MRALPLLLVAILSSCGGEPCYRGYFMNLTSLPVSVDYETAGGVQVDNKTNYAIDNQYLDNTVTMMELCLNRLGKIKTQPEWQCLSEYVEVKVFKRDCIIIKIVDPISSECSSWQFIGVDAPNEMCIEKGLVYNPRCPCQWRSAIQDDNVLVTPPELYLWDLIRMTTACNNIWASKELTSCSF